MNAITPELATQWFMFVFIAGVGLIVLWKLFSNEINIGSILEETQGKASMSRFQFLLFTFVIVGTYAAICIQDGSLVEVSNGVLGLMGISGGSYVVSKGIQIQANKTDAKQADSNPPTPRPA